MLDQTGQLATKDDAGKSRVDLIPTDVLLGVGKVFAFGAEKYSEREWEAGMRHGSIFAAALRHAYAHQTGEDLDRESGLPHVDHAIASLMMLSALIKRDMGTDDRNPWGMCGLDKTDLDTKNLN